MTKVPKIGPFETGEDVLANCNTKQAQAKATTVAQKVATSELLGRIYRKMSLAKMEQEDLQACAQEKLSIILNMRLVLSRQCDGRRDIEHNKCGRITQREEDAICNLIHLLEKNNAGFTWKHRLSK